MKFMNLAGMALIILANVFMLIFFALYGVEEITSTFNRPVLGWIGLIFLGVLWLTALVMAIYRMVWDIRNGGKSC